MENQGVSCLKVEQREFVLESYGKNREEEKTQVQKFLGFFAPREIQNHYLKLRIVVTVKYI